MFSHWFFTASDEDLGDPASLLLQGVQTSTADGLDIFVSHDFSSHLEVIFSEVQYVLGTYIAPPG